MDEDIFGVLCIIAFVIYPFATAGLARRISRGLRDCRYRRLLTKVFAWVGLIPAGLLIVAAPWAKIPSVCVVAALVLVLWFSATGAVIGSLFDWRRERDPRAH